MNSQRFQELHARLVELETNFLPEPLVKPSYTDKEQDLARGYRLLVHAEIESYLEDMSRNSITDAIRKWKVNRHPSRQLISFISCYHSSWSPTDNESNEIILQIAKSRINAKESVEKVIDLAQKQFTTKLKNNHGIKEENLHLLIVPIGIDLSDLDQNWIANLDNFGAQRGAIAHNQKKTSDTINPSDEYANVQRILIGLKELDVKINSF